MSVNSTNPGTLFGGTWQRIQNQFLLAAGSSYAAGSTGGSATVTLNVNQIPSHTHGEYPELWANAPFTVVGDGKHYVERNNIYGNYMTVESASGGGRAKLYTSAAGGGQAHNNMPPYIAVYVWKRTA